MPLDAGLTVCSLTNLCLNRQQLEALATVVGVEADKLEQMLSYFGYGDESQSNSIVWGVLCRLAL